MARVAKAKTVNVKQMSSRKRRIEAATSNSKRARALASAIESHMRESGLSENEKDERVSRFADRVDRATSSHAKS